MRDFILCSVLLHTSIPLNQVEFEFESGFDLMKISNKDCDSQLYTLREKCPYSELLWPVFSCFRKEYGKILCIFPPYSVRMQENKDRNNSEYGQFLRSG